jgi:hypothetical protein
MSSSISSSDSGSSRPAHLQCLACFAATFVPLLLCTSIGWRLWAPDRSTAPKGVELVDDDRYTAHGQFQYDHSTFFEGDRRLLEPLSSADVVFLGNSRMMFTLPQRLLKPFFMDRQIRYYLMGFGYGEGDAFPEMIMRKFSIWPRVVIVNANSAEFFSGRLSAFARKTIKQSWFDRRKEHFEAEAKSLANYWLNLQLPHFASEDLGRSRMFLTYRSWRDGTWHLPWDEKGFISKRIPFDESETDDDITESTIEEARRFKGELERHGCRLILMHVPYPAASRRKSEKIARVLDVPLIAPRLGSAETVDDSHLTPEFGERYTLLFLKELDDLLKREPMLLAPRSPVKRSPDVAIRSADR